ncbi:parafibromin [Drosophila biarmipes]|uniref:parafibromin n=1 Tax=Drosophila biarmipes TaxID=125945 RepID=UPI0007E758BE|nr:parafibromin [Drosophila biarmipes]XP_043947765.1 parafibromin [Drosophila biarmipes]
MSKRANQSEMDLSSKTLSQTMTVEAIAAIKAKRMAMKKDLDVEGKRKRTLQREQDRQEHEEQAEFCKRTMEREWQHRTREEQLLGEKELPGVLKCLSLVYDSKRRRMLSMTEDSPPEGARIHPPHGGLQQVPVVLSELETIKLAPMSKYNRYGQERFLRGKQEFGINPQGTHWEKVKSSDLNPEHRKIESLDIDKKNGTLEMANSANKRPRYNKRFLRMPIIVVPAALTSLVTVHNARQLLQEMRYVSVEKARQSMVSGQPTAEVTVEHCFQGDLVSYRVIDNVTRLTSEEWKRVAALFAMGPHWQFKDWPHGGDPALIFHQVCAFHLHFKGSPVCKELHNLQVHLLALSPNERHSDSGILTEFWNKLDHHMAVHPRQFAFIKQK